MLDDESVSKQGLSRARESLSQYAMKSENRRKKAERPVAKILTIDQEDQIDGTHGTEGGRIRETNF